jgi:glycosyltransferase involved in cell wall biosynthesis
VDVSIIVPLYNEQDNVIPLYEALTAEMDRLKLKYEIVLVDDGSDDDTYPKAYALTRQDQRLKIVKFRKNYGQTTAIAAGIQYASGNILVTLDGDMQNDPADIARLLVKIREGHDLVVGWRHQRQDTFFLRKLPSVIANGLIARVTGVPVRDNGCTLKAYRAELVKNVPLYSEMHRFIPAMFSLTGARITEVKVRHHARRFGRSKYGLSRTYKVLFDLLTVKTLISFSMRPLLLFAILAIPPLFISMTGIAYSVIMLIVYSQPFSTAIAGTGMVFGSLALMLLLSGVLAELLCVTGDIKQERFARLTADYVPPLTRWEMQK